MLTRRRLLALASLSSAALLAGCDLRTRGRQQAAVPGPAGTPYPAENLRPPTDRERAFEFAEGLNWINVERPLTLNGDLRGRVVLLDFWTLGCINCQHIIPDIKRLEAEFGDALVVVGVHSGKYDAEKSTDLIRDAVRRYERFHPVVNDDGFEIWDTYQVDAWPTVVLIDAEGRVVGRHAGEGVYDVVAPAIAALVLEATADGTLTRPPLPLKIDAATGPASALSAPGKVLADPAGGRLFIADTGHHRIIVADLATGAVRQTVGAGSPGLQDGDLAAARFNGPQGMTLSPDGRTLYVADTLNHAIRRVDLQARTVTTIAGDGRQADFPLRAAIDAKGARLSSPWDVLLDDDLLFIAGAGTHQIWLLNLARGKIEAFAGFGGEGIDDASRERSTLAQPEGLAALDGLLYWVDPEGSALRRTALDGKNRVETLVGRGLFRWGDKDGVGKAAELQHPEGITAANGLVYIADTYNRAVKVFNPKNDEVTTLWRYNQALGREAPALQEPSGLSVAGDTLYIADRRNDGIFTLDLATGRAGTFPIGTVQPVASGDNGTRVTLPAARVAPGSTPLRLTLRTPDGYRLNSLAPSRLEAVSDAPAVRPLERALTWSSDATETTVELPLDLAAGSATLTLQGTIYYCRKVDEALCFVHRIALTQPLTITADAPTGPIQTEYRLPAV